MIKTEDTRAKEVPSGTKKLVIAVKTPIKKPPNQEIVMEICSDSFWSSILILFPKLENIPQRKTVKTKKTNISRGRAAIRL